MLKIGIITGSTRPLRKNEIVAQWVFSVASKRNDAQFEYVDILEYNLPLLDEPISTSEGIYSKEHTKMWSKKIASLDAFIIVSPEYNHSTSAALKNALDFLYTEWNNKVVGFVSYGFAGGVRAVEHLRQIVAELQMADVSTHIKLYFNTDFDDKLSFKPTKSKENSLNEQIDQIITWGEALRPIRIKR